MSNQEEILTSNASYDLIAAILDSTRNVFEELSYDHKIVSIVQLEEPKLYYNLLRILLPNKLDELEKTIKLKPAYMMHSLLKIFFEEHEIPTNSASILEGDLNSLHQLWIILEEFAKNFMQEKSRVKVCGFEDAFYLVGLQKKEVSEGLEKMKDRNISALKKKDYSLENELTEKVEEQRNLQIELITEGLRDSKVQSIKDARKASAAGKDAVRQAKTLLHQLNESEKEIANKHLSEAARLRHFKEKEHKKGLFTAPEFMPPSQNIADELEVEREIHLKELILGRFKQDIKDLTSNRLLKISQAPIEPEVVDTAKDSAAAVRSLLRATERELRAMGNKLVGKQKKIKRK